jgi:type VI secretion system protein ImpM
MVSPVPLGLFGKLPWEGDFIQRGLSSRFVRPWDSWLSQAMAASREALGAAWSEAYLLSPPWCFLIEAEIIGASGWAGVLVSSVDKVSRYFPLTLAVELPPPDAALDHAASLRPLYRLLEQAALALIEEQRPLDEALAQTAAALEPALAAARAQRPRRLAWRLEGEERARVAIALSGDQAPLAASGRLASLPVPQSLWWHDRWDRHPPAAIRSRGLPAPEAFAGFLDGSWDAHGWREASAGAGP